LKKEIVSIIWQQVIHISEIIESETLKTFFFNFRNSCKKWDLILTYEFYGVMRNFRSIVNKFKYLIMAF
jgi:hypothetical protein